MLFPSLQVSLRWTSTIFTLLMLLCNRAWGEANPIFKGLSSKIESRRFVFYSNLPRGKLRRYVEFSNLFLDVVDRDFVRLRNLRRMDAVVLSDRSRMQRFLAQRLRRNEPPLFGIYIAEHHLFVTYDGSGLGTFSHEIMHPVMERELPRAPSWAWEGVPTFFEKFYGYKEGNRLYLKWGYQNPWRIQALGERLLGLRLAQVIHESTNQSELRLVSVFLYKRGKLKSFLDLVARGNRKGYGTYVEAALGRRPPELEGEWRKYLSDVYARRAQIYRLPTSRYFPSKQKFLVFERQIGLP